jgi:hypothetical protein
VPSAPPIGTGGNDSHEIFAMAIATARRRLSPLIAREEGDTVLLRRHFSFGGGGMRILFALIALLCTAPVQADSLWSYNGSTFLLNGDGKVRELTYETVRPNLPVSKGTTVFKGIANGNHYTGTAYAFSATCGAIG